MLSREVTASYGGHEIVFSVNIRINGSASATLYIDSERVDQKDAGPLTWVPHGELILRGRIRMGQRDIPVKATLDDGMFQRTRYTISVNNQIVHQEKAWH